MADLKTNEMIVLRFGPKRLDSEEDESEHAESERAGNSDFGSSDFSRSVDSREDDLIIFLHGFPSLRSKQNRELAEIVSQTNSVEVLLPLYSGLGFSKGTFLFSECRANVEAWATRLVRERRAAGWTGELKIVGHSWGGFLSLALAQIPEIAALLTQVILLSPLVHFAKALNVAPAFAHMTSQTELVLNLPETQALADDFQRVGEKVDVSQMIQQLSPNLRVTYLQAKTDLMTPPALAEKMRVHFRCHFDFSLVDQEHSFLTDRPALGLTLAQILRARRSRSAHSDT